MIIVKDERQYIDKNSGECEQCHKTAPGRKVEIGASAFGGAGRGWYFLCYECWKPRIFWKPSQNSEVNESPAE